MSSSNSNEKSDTYSMKNAVTYEDIVIVAPRVVNDSSVQVLDYSLSPYSRNKLGFLGLHQQLKIEIKKTNSDDQEELSLFVKSVPYDCPGELLYIKEEDVFVEECNFFSRIGPQLVENYAGDKWLPACYLAKKDALIMEDLRCQGYVVRGSFYDRGVELRSALAATARLHGCSILMEARLSRSAKRRVTLKDAYPSSFRERAFKRDGQSYRWVFSGINLACIVGSRFGHDSRKMRKAFDQLFKSVKASPIHRNVLCHGDLWTNNIMFADSSSPPKCVLVDYQMYRYAPLVLDILQLLYLHTSRDFRRDNEEALVVFYHSVLKETITSSDLAKEAGVPSLQEIFVALKELRVFGPATACLYFPIVLMDPEIVMEKLSESDGFNSFILGDKTDVTLSYMENNALFKKKFLEVIEELSGACGDFSGAGRV